MLDPRVRSLRLRRSLVFCGGHGVAPILPIGPKRTAAEPRRPTLITFVVLLAYTLECYTSQSLVGI